MFHALLLVCALAMTLANPASHAAAPEGGKQPQIKITWLGGPTTLIEFNGLRILTDPMFGEGDQAFTMGDPNEMFDLRTGPNVKAHRRVTPFPGTVPKAVHLVLLSHAHEDHLDQKAQAELNRAVPMILPVADAGKIKAMGFKRVDGVKWGETRSFKAGKGRVAITAVRADHSENPQIAAILGAGNGYWIEFSEGRWKRSLYWTGDSLPTGAVLEAVQKLGKPDILMAHLGAVGTTGPLGLVSMRVDQVAALAEKISARKVLPIHHSTYAFYLEPVGKLAELSAGKPYGLDLISEGTTVLYD